MAVRAPSWLQAGSYPAENDRLLLQNLLGGSLNSALIGGVIGFADLKITPTGTPDMHVHAAVGGAFIPGTENTNQGAYGLVNDASVDITLAASSGSNPRISLIVAQVLDDSYSGGSHIGQIVEVAGTPALSPVAPAVPRNAIKLASVIVGTSVTSISAGNITDARTFFCSKLLTVGNTTAGNRATPDRPGAMNYDSDTATLMIWNGTAWVQVLPIDTAQSALSFGSGWANIGGIWATAAYRKIGSRVYLRGGVVLTGTVSATLGTLSTIGTLPSGYRPVAQVGFPNADATKVRVEVTAAGVVQIENGSAGVLTNPTVFLDNVSFDTI